MAKAYLGFDLGASSGRAVVGTLAGGRLETQEIHRFRTPRIESDGHLYWDLDELWREVGKGLRKALEVAPDLRSISIDSWGVDYVPLDENLRPLRNPYSYRDTRTRGRMEQAYGKVSASEIYERTGIQMMPINTLYQLLDDVENEPEVVERTHVRLFIADYLLYRLSGSTVAERTMASTTQLLNVGTGEWDRELMRRLGIPDDQWPRIVPPGTVLGPLKDEFCDRPIDVIAGCSHDTAAAVAAVPAEDSARTWAYLSCGTWSLMGIESRNPYLGSAAQAANFTNEGGLDGTFRVLKNLTGLWVLQECKSEWSEKDSTISYDELTAEAAASTFGGHVIDLNEPQFREAGNMVAKIQTYCRDHGFPEPKTRGQIVRLIVESLAAANSETLKELEELVGRPIDVLHIVGGGSRNELLCRLTANACGCEVISGPAEATCMGNLLVQARALGDLDGSIRDVVRRSCQPKTYVPSKMPSPGSAAST